VGIGVLLGVIINWFQLYSEYVIRSSSTNYSHFPFYTFFSYAMLAVFVRPALRRLTGRYLLSRSELFTILLMTWAAGMVPANGLVGFMIVVMATPFYHATPENGWAELMHNHIPKWIAPSDPEITRGFFEGLPAGESIPWDAWIVPLFWWSGFVIAVAGVSMAVVTLLKRQWVSHERLTFPLVSVAVDLAGDPNKIKHWLLRNRFFWIGFALGFGVLLWNIPGHFYPTFPQFFMGRTYHPLARGFPSLVSKVSPYVIGFAYFVNLDVLFSMWIFHLVSIVQRGVMNRVGMGTGGNEDQWSYGYTGYEAYGAMAFMVVWGLWVGRRYLIDVLKKAWDPSHPIEESDGMMSYRTALATFILGSIYCILWLSQAGMELRVILVLGIGNLILYIGISRIVSEAGIVYVRGPMSAQVLSLYAFGTQSLSPATVTATGFSYTTIAQGTGLFMPRFMQMGRLQDFVGGNRRKILAAVGIAFVVALVTSIVVTLYFGYTHGTQNFNTWHIRSGGQTVFNDTASKISSPFPTDWIRIRHFGYGILAMAMLTQLRYWMPQWPLHPIGLTVGVTYFTQQTFAGVFLAWIIKLVVLKVGGVSTYRRLQPLFIGLLVGYSLGIALTALVDLFFFPGQGHYIHSV